MSLKLFLVASLTCAAMFGLVSRSGAASEPQKLKIVYASLTAAYTPLWIAVEKRLGRKHGLDIESVYVGRGVRPHQLLISGDAQYVASTGTGVVASYAVGLKDLVIIASFADSTGASIFSKPEIKSLAELRGKSIGAGRPGGLSDTLLAYILKRRLGLDPTREVKVVRLGDDPSILPALEHGVVDAGMLTTPARWMARKRGFRELLDLDALGFQYPYVGISTLKANVKKNPETTGKLIRTLIDGIEIFKTNQEDSLAAMRRYLRGANDEILAETYRYARSRIQKFPYPSVEAIKTALEMMSDHYPQARHVDPFDVVDLSFVREVERHRVLQ
jgi:ABC-type nitrate/sulfonate/bicarbonate transport system substrate-binding protein